MGQMQWRNSIREASSIIQVRLICFVSITVSKFGVISFIAAVGGRGQVSGASKTNRIDKRWGQWGSGMSP
jgi:hypothetical protein